ncbi:HEAT repeat domain-containing protein [Marinobacterium arenosum]|uniref:HEAT repeat domain-containing protein n=1 Tax=Marinobacterium arenosum TaxID=2862496 RepID=UPI001C986478|nr:HEAT repeat domain-containing protein [Marinobacterium arenosum]MBY4677828.1 HEAT repeat domain-containing protein [Marinobacterium arenosum]
MDKLDEINLINIDSKAGIDRLLVLSEDSDYEVRLRSIEKLADVMDIKRVSRRVIDGLGDKDYLVRAESLDAISNLQPPPPFKAIKTCLDDKHWLIRGSSAIVLAKFFNSRVKDIISNRYMTVSCEEERLRYAAALCIIDNCQSLNDLCSFFNSDCYRVRCALSNLLVEIVEFFDEENITDRCLEKLRDNLMREKLDVVREDMEKAILDLEAFGELG